MDDNVSDGRPVVAVDLDRLGWGAAGRLREPDIAAEPDQRCDVALSSAQDLRVRDDRLVTWQSLPPRAKAWRLLHASWSVAQLGCLAYIWACVIARRRTHKVWASVAFLVTEGAALVVGRGNCPVGSLQAEWGDPVPFFELVLPPRAAKAAIPALTWISLAAIAGLAFRRPGLVGRAYGLGRHQS